MVDAGTRGIHDGAERFAALGKRQDSGNLVGDTLRVGRALRVEKSIMRFVGTRHQRVQVSVRRASLTIVRRTWRKLTQDASLPEERLTPAHPLWDLLTAHREGTRTERFPGTLAGSRTAAAGRALAVSEHGDAH